MRFLWPALGIALVAVWLRTLLQAMPPPFDDLVALPIPTGRQALYPGKADGSKMPPAFSGVFRHNARLKEATRLFQGQVLGSESVAVSPSGVLVMIDRRGFVFRAHMSATGYQLLGTPLYIGPGRPLGFHLQGEDELYVCDSLKGLLRVQLSSGAIEVLANAVKASDGGEPQPINYANDLDIGRDGSVYFTSCTDGSVARNTLGFYDTMFSYMLSALRGAADGRLLRWDPVTRKTIVLADGFSYANGVALSADESWLAVVETNFARVHRHWLRGPRSGETEVLLAGLPGFPDGISRSPDGGFWVGLVAPLSPLLGVLSPYPWARQLCSHVIRRVLPLVAKRWGAIVKLNAEGEPSHALYDLDGSRVSSISAVTEHEGRLFLGNLGGDYVSYIDLMADEKKVSHVRN